MRGWRPHLPVGWDSVSSGPAAAHKQKAPPPAPLPGPPFPPRMARAPQLGIREALGPAPASLSASSPRSSHGRSHCSPPTRSNRQGPQSCSPKSRGAPSPFTACPPPGLEPLYPDLAQQPAPATLASALPAVPQGLPAPPSAGLSDLTLSSSGSLQHPHSCLSPA